MRDDAVNGPVINCIICTLKDAIVVMLSRKMQSPLISHLRRTPFDDSDDIDGMPT